MSIHHTPEPRRESIGAVDVGNWSMVSSNGTTISCLNPIFMAQPMTKDQALVVAAWLVSLADPLQERFPDILSRVQNT